VRCDATTFRTVATRNGQLEASWIEPLDALDWLSRTFPAPDGRWIGYVSYDLGRVFERVPSIAADDLGLPLFVFTFHQQTVGKSQFEAPEHLVMERPLSSTFSRDQYLHTVERAIEYIRSGDIFQVNLAQRFTAGLQSQPRDVWNRLIQATPGEFGAYLDFGDFALLSNSPELFLRVSPDRTVITRPIKGTRPRLPGMEEELRRSSKDQAELNMIVDLERNDLGRVCEVGSVKVTEPRVIEAHPTIYHGVATIEGRLRRDVGFVDLLRATFPGGSITGAPKIRAMQIIEELEPVRRGPYCGAIGYIAADGTIEFNIAIRTMIIKDGLVHIPVGGGIVADSDPAAEYEETLVKARAMFAAVEISLEVRS
jgi:para-aminobenzoate synthetase component I